MRILVIVPSYKPAYVYGGPIESVAKLCEGLAVSGHDVHVYTTAANGKTELDVPLGKPLNIDGAWVTYFKRITKDHTHVSPTLWKHLSQTVKEFDIVHIQSWWSPLVIISAYICFQKKVKFIISPRGMLSDYIINSGNSKAKKLIHRTVGKFILSKSVFHATSEAEFKECTTLINNWRGFMLPNILSLPDLEIDAHKNDVFTIIFMSRIHPKKGIEILFKAIKDLDFEVKLRIAGSGEEQYVAELKQLAEKISIADKIEWLGWQSREQKFNELMQADLFALISYNENFANVVVESLHMGTPVLLSNHVALSTFVKKHDVGWVTSLDIENVKRNIIEIYKDTVKRNLINTSGRRVIRQYFAADKLINDYANAYQNIVSNANMLKS